MATQTLSNFDPFLKNAYRGTIVELLNDECYAIGRFQSKHASDIGTFTGRELIFAVHTARNRGRGVASDGGTLTAAGRQSGLNGIVGIKYFNQGIELTDLTIKQSMTDEGAFVRAMDYEMTRAMTDMKKDICRQVYGTGDGLLATCTTSETTATIHVDTIQYIGVGDVVDVIVKSSGATSTGVLAATVTAVTPGGTAGSSTQANGTIAISSITVDTTFGVYLAGDRSNETDGLQNITNTGRILHQINSSTNKIWDGNVSAQNYVNANEDIFMQQAQVIQQRSGTRPNGFLTTLGVQRRLANTYVSQKRWNDDRATQVDGGYEAINIAAGGKTTPVIADTYAANGFAFTLNDDAFAWAELQRPDWLSAPDAKGSIFRLKDGTTAGTSVATWQANVVWPAALVCVAPNRVGQISQLNDDKPVVLDS